jgi:integrative and conjugative element protein (TIGR02256 family)
VILQCGHGRLILVSERVERAMGVFVTDAQITLEAGGILIGSYRGPHIEISDCTTPLSADIRQAHLFDRRDPGHQACALRAWRASGKTATFVGEWHTHPQDDPAPSGIDLRGWKTLLERTVDPLVFLIAGRQSLWCGLATGRSHVNSTEGSQRVLQCLPR